jgi:prevent-host-death family protein
MRGISSIAEPVMQRVNLTEFRRNVSGLINRVEQGETILVVRHGYPVAEVSPAAATPTTVPSWKRPSVPLVIRGATLSRAIIEERGDEDVS